MWSEDIDSTALHLRTRGGAVCNAAGAVERETLVVTQISTDDWSFIIFTYKTELRDGTVIDGC